MDKNELFQLFFQEKPTRMLIELYLNSNEVLYGSTLAKRVDCTYSHVIKIVKNFEKFGLISVKKNGRLNLIELTELGKRVGKTLLEAVSVLDQIE